MTRYVYQGLKRDLVLKIAGITKHQYYYQNKPGKQGRRPSKTCLKMVDNEAAKVLNEEVAKSMTTISEDPDTDYGYHKMTFALMLLGYIINHKKVYRLMQENMLLKERYERQSRPFVKYRRVIPEGPLQVLEMDIKFVWVEQT